MPQDLRNVIQTLRYELNYLEQGGFERDRQLQKSNSPFLSSFTCINFNDPMPTHACRECLLYQFVPENKKNEEVPCHSIPVGSNGETVGELIAANNPKRLTSELCNWLRATIARLETNLAEDERDEIKEHS